MEVGEAIRQAPLRPCQKQPATRPPIGCTATCVPTRIWNARKRTRLRTKHHHSIGPPTSAPSTTRRCGQAAASSTYVARLRRWPWLQDNVAFWSHFLARHSDPWLSPEWQPAAGIRAPTPDDVLERRPWRSTRPSARHGQGPCQPQPAARPPPAGIPAPTPEHVSQPQSIGSSS